MEPNNSLCRLFHPINGIFVPPLIVKSTPPSATLNSEFHSKPRGSLLLDQLQSFGLQAPTINAAIAFRYHRPAKEPTPAKTGIQSALLPIAKSFLNPVQVNIVSL